MEARAGHGGTNTYGYEYGRRVYRELRFVHACCGGLHHPKRRRSVALHDGSVELEMGWKRFEFDLRVHGVGMHLRRQCSRCRTAGLERGNGCFRQPEA